MKYENFKVPAYYLQKGVDKLVKYGMSTFGFYADEVGMSYCDRNRVIGKCKRAYGQTDLKELACPKNLIGERWTYYTKELKYTDEKAREILKFIDSSYENQFVPSNIKRLARGIG